MTMPHDDRDSLALSAALDRRLINAAGDSIRHLVITVRAPQPPRHEDSERLPLNLGMVIDASGSMQGPPLSAAKSATLDVIQSLDADDHLSLVSFASDVQVHATAVRLDTHGKRMAEAAVRPLVTRGSTALCDGWLGGCEAVATRQAVITNAERHHVVLLSDGHANQGECAPEALARHASELRQRGIVTSTVGIGQHYSPTQLQAIAEAGGGRMHDAELPEEIARIVLAELNDTLATTVENLEVRVDLPAGVHAELYGSAPLTLHGRRCDVLLGSLLGGATRQIVLKLRFPAGEQGHRLPIAVRARWNAPGQTDVHDCVANAVEPEFTTARHCVRQARDVDTAVIVAEQWRAFIIHEAMKLNQDGQYRQAAAFVQRELRYFSQYCAGVPELATMLEGLDDFEPSLLHRYSAETSKELMLRSYKTSRHETDHRVRAFHSFSDLLAEERRSRGHS